MERRSQSLVNMDHAVRFEDGRIRVSKDFIANLQRAEINRVAKAMAAERRLTFTAALGTSSKSLASRARVGLAMQVRHGSNPPQCRGNLETPI